LFPLAHLGVHCAREALGRIVHVWAAKSNGNIGNNGTISRNISQYLRQYLAAVSA
jgi:hypothetical protein